MQIPSAIRTLLVSAAIAMPVAAFAQSAAPMQNPAVAEAVNACRDDRARLCADITPGGGRVLRCLAAQAPAVSRPCKSALIRARDTLAAKGIAVQGLADK